MSPPFTHRFRVRYSEVDPQSVVFNSRYLEYADLILTEYWRSIGLHFTGDDALEFHVVKAVVEFKQPIRADEEIDGTAVTTRIGSSSVTIEIRLYGMGGEDDLRAIIELVYVHVDLESGKPVPIPEDAKARLLAK
ncbi:acyl-CoA thioesterase [Parasphingopyxis lamellibrachiae]|uniref:Acyl-CoA thioester hydrolase n=1 Tax=Parasphingopyxis lamellibrachiae TaxID=680125 RepID=A0A3D9FJ68_9SPHN|nr:thioesterase family protein [Parasphingopyxis lamellibrachiae]RED17627.1 acyl-CoA thioester hydrolase [Parasphingopyxis lamellibrachiae]